ncbi:MAG TPA: class I SAM-dependent methyltransferase [Chlamydiales bacterium]|nr:class I SAM-dependent methyltransferase [Chlamydiales bacterium]
MSISSKRLWRDRLQTIRHYYTSPRFALIDLAFGFVALFMNPYRICRKFNQKKRLQNVYSYGETPLATYQRIAAICQIGPEDTWVEMGAGRGKGCFWLAHFLKCEVIGIEWVPSFIFVARALQSLFRIKNIRFACTDFEKADISSATVIYLYGSWPKLKIPQGAKVISISEPLPDCQVLKTFWVRYPWGRTTAFLQQQKK